MKNLTVLVLVIVLVNMVACNASNGESNSLAQVPSTISSVTESSEVEELNNAQNGTVADRLSGVIRMGESTEVQGLIITINSSRIGEPAMFLNPSDGNIYVLDITFDNTTDKPVTISSLLQMSIVDNAGYSYDIALYTDTKGSLDGEVSPGRKLRGEVAFEIPSDVESIEFVYDPIFGRQVYFDVPNVWETIAVNDHGLTTAQMDNLRNALSKANITVHSIADVVTEDVMGNIAYAFISSVGRVEAEIIDDEVICIAGELKNGNLKIYFITDELKTTFKDGLGDAFDLDAMVIIIG